MTTVPLVIWLPKNTSVYHPTNSAPLKVADGNPPAASPYVSLRVTVLCVLDAPPIVPPFPLNVTVYVFVLAERYCDVTPPIV